MEIGLDESTTPKSLNFFIEGVRCAKCVQKLESLSHEHQELRESRFNKSKNLLTLDLSKELSPASAIEWIESKGYKAYFVESSQQTEERRQQAHRRWLTRLAVTFFFASNLMMFAIAIYMGAYGEWHRLFAWFCGILFLPIAFYSAIPFYQSAWQALKERRFSADLAIVIAFTWGSGLSYVNLFRGSPDFYFDSTASFLFLILLARFFLDKAQNSIESDLNPSLLFKNSPLFLVTRSGQTTKLLFQQIQTGDELHLEHGQTLPVDIELLDSVAEIDTSLFSGESLPQTFYSGQTIKAGMVILNSTLRGKALGSFEKSELNDIFEGVVRNRHEKTKAHAQAEIYSHRLLTAVSILSIALLIFFGLQQQWSEGFRRALALFTIACPCALALAIPLASIMTLKRAMEKGLFVKSPLFFEKLRTIKGVVFDKTGTITQGRLELVAWEPEEPPSDLWPILLSMEQRSQHPIAKSITRELHNRNIEPCPLDSWKETPGVGVEATVNGQTYRLSRLSDSTYKDLTGCELTCNDKLLLKAYFKDQVRTEAGPLVAWLKRNNLEIFLLSGDRVEVVASIAKELGIDFANTQSPLTPAEKSDFLTRAKAANNHYLMVGDGHNDALALSRATCSLAVKGCAETSLRAADAYAQKNDLGILKTAFNLSHFYDRLIRQNVGLSLTYNIIAGSMAALGLVDPLMAAVLMPLNSLVVIGATVLAQPKKTEEIL